MEWKEIEEQEFYELMQTYRHMPLVNQEETVRAFEDVKSYIKSLLTSAYERGREDERTEQKKRAIEFERLESEEK